MTLFGIEFSAAQTFLFAVNVLVLLLCIIILRRLGKLMPDEQAEAQNTQETGLETKPVDQKSSQYEDDELIAVITAAVAATMGKGTQEIKITACKEIPRREYTGRSAWSRAGRNEQLNRYI